MSSRKVFISSTSQDLAEYRKAAAEAIAGMDDCYSDHMGRFGARDCEVEDFCLKQVRKCDLYVGIIGPLYGSSPEGGGPSYTEREYDEAERAGIPRLIFLSSDDFPLPEGLTEPEEQRQKQLAFRERVSRGRIRTVFTSAENLKTLLVQAIRNWEWEQAGPARRHARAAVVGRDVHKRCDRTKQVNQFGIAFSQARQQHLGKPQVYMLTGEQDECHDSLIDRLLTDFIEPWAEGARGRSKVGVATPELFTWTFEGTPDELRRELLIMLFNRFAPSYHLPDLSADALSRLPVWSEVPAVVIRHSIHAEHWNAQTAPLVEWYLSYWARLTPAPSAPQFLIFISVIHTPPEPRGRWQFWKFRGPSSGFDPERVGHELEAIAARAQLPCRVLWPLGPPQKSELDAWFATHGFYDTTDDRLKHSETVFKACGGRLNMRAVERELRGVVKQWSG